VFWLTIARVCGQVFSWIITIYVVRILSPSDYGLIAMAGVYVGFVTLFSELGLNAAVVQKKELDRDDLSNISWTVLFLNLGLCGLSFLLAPAVASFYNEPRVIDVIRVASLVFVIRGLGFAPSNMLVRELMLNRASQAELIANTGGAVTTLLFAVLGFGVWSLVYGTMVMEGVRSLCCFLFYPWKPRLSFSLSGIKGMIDFGWKAAVARLIWYFYANMDVLIAGRILGKAQLGYYSVATQLALMPLDKLMGSTVSHVGLPAFSKVQDDPVRLTRYFLKIVNVLAFVSFPVCWGIFLVAGSVIPLVLSEKWRPAVLPLQILSMITAFRSIHLINAPLEMAVGRPDVTMRNFAIITLVLAVSFFVGAPYGLAGLAYAWLVFPIVFLITTSITLRLIDVPLLTYLKELRHPFMGTGFMVSTVWLAQELVLENYGLAAQAVGSIVVGVISYLAYYTLFNREMFFEARRLLRR
jgi:O-antigen/teichoic acid export membrane protein